MCLMKNSKKLCGFSPEKVPSIFSEAFHGAQTQESCGMLGIIIIL